MTIKQYYALVAKVTVVGIITLLFSLFFGCARFHTTQYDYSYDGTNGVPTRKITTRASATTFFEASSSLANFKASQTDKTQGASVGTLNQIASATNASKIFESIGKGVVDGLKATP